MQYWVAGACLIAASIAYKRARDRLTRRDRRPQTGFRQVLADTSDAPFEHFQSACHDIPDSPNEQAGKGVSDQQHPFSDAIKKLLQDRSPKSLPFTNVAAPEATKPAALIWVGDMESLREMTGTLEQQDVFALDVEHHSEHSYLGFTCLLQISTGGTEYVVDAIALHDHLHVLRDILADPRITKVLHGGDNDVLWLQRDFHLYIVNAFDTEKACQVLEREERSLGSLLEDFCGVRKQKQHQRADWRQRPLPWELLEYAQTDVHYLCYLAGQLCAQLASRGPGCPQEASRRSHEMCLALYSKPGSEAAANAATMAALRRANAPAAQAHPHKDASISRMADCMHALCCWRDKRARRLDEGAQWIMPEKLLLSLGQSPPESARAVCKRAAGLHFGGISKDDARELYSVVEEAQLGMHPWQPPAVQRPGKRTKTKEQVEERRARLIRSFCAKAPVYENCRMLSHDGEPLSFIDYRKLAWYEARGLAERVAEDPPTIRLLFRHKNEDQVTGTDQFYSERKRNCCVACGEADHYLRYRVVPACYRRAFPVHLKSHRSHDVVLLCFNCHQVALTAAERLKREVSREFGVPMQPPPPPLPQATFGDQALPEKAMHPTNIRRAALALEAHAHSMPQQRREHLSMLVRAHVLANTDVQTLPGGPLSDGELQEGLMAGYGTRARRKHMQRHARKLGAYHSMQQALLTTQDQNSNTISESSEDDDSRIPNSASCNAETPALAAGSSVATERLSEESCSSTHGSVQEQDATAEATTVSEDKHSSDETAANAAQTSERPINGGEQSQSAAPRTSVTDLGRGGHFWHGERVVEAALQRSGEEELLQLMARFRQCFVDALQPQHLSSSWQINHSSRRAFGDFSVYSNKHQGSNGNNSELVGLEGAPTKR